MPAPSRTAIVGPNGLVDATWLNYFAEIEQGGGVSTFSNVTINRSSAGVSITVATDAAALTGTTLAPNVVASSLSGVGTLTSGALGPGFVLGLSVVTLTGALPWVNMPAGAGNWSAAPTITGTMTVAADIQPLLNYTTNLGSINKKLLAIYAAELWVETLVAANTMATIGGRVLVAPTTELTADLTAAATTIQVKHNNLLNGHRVRLEANGQLEWMAITSVASGSVGAYLYSVTRNLDGSGANAWPAGSAVLSTGTTGDGFIDLYSVSGVLSGSGPTIVGNVRTGTTYNQIEPRWAIGNLNGLYGYVSTTYGTAFGEPSGAWIKIDPVNGVRIGYDTATYVVLSSIAGPSITIGNGPSAFDATASLKFNRESSFGVGPTNVFGLWSQSSGGAYQDLVLENYADRSAAAVGLGADAKASVYLKTTGWSGSGNHALGTVSVRLRSEVGVNQIDVTTDLTVLSGALRVAGRCGPAQITANQNNYSPTGLSAAFKLYITSDAARDITGLQAQADGYLLWIFNFGGFTISLKHQDAASSAANRFYTATGATVAIRAGGSVLVQYDTGAFGTGAWIVLGA